MRAAEIPYINTMHFDWTLEHQQGQPAVGMLFEYSSKLTKPPGTDIIPAKVVMQSYPQLPKAGFARIVHVSVFLACSRDRVTDGFFHWIRDDIAELIRGKEAAIFPQPSQPLENFQTQVLLCQRLPAFEVFTAGAYAVR